MSRDIPGTTSNYLSRSSIRNPNAGPCSISLWCWVDAWNSGTTSSTCVSQEDGSGTGRNLLYFGGASSTSRPVRTFLQGSQVDGATNNFSRTSEWIHMGVSWSSGGSGTVKVYLDGAEDGSGTRDPESATGNWRFGTSKSDTAILNGRLAEIGVWFVVLDAAEWAALGAGVSPVSIRPDSRLAWYPLVDDLHGPDSGVTLTETGTVAVANHPPIIYPAAPTILAPPSILCNLSGTVTESLDEADVVAGRLL